ncbi:hypothetical protein Q8F55_003889 [Vanrija albida]|uniref:Ecp2 effector protein domain-containing protein n=1 Tax=Vanrija albida TaxID=181172 RepID=A0ABR3Q585_9TREE
MLFHTIVLTLTAALVTAAPAPEVQGGAVASTPGPVPSRLSVGAGTQTKRGSNPQIVEPIFYKIERSPETAQDDDADTPQNLARDSASVNVRCFDRPDCTGNEIFPAGTVYTIPRGWMALWPYTQAGDILGSCRFDVWNNFGGKFWMMADAPSGKKPWDQPHVSGENFSNGWGQYCVNQWKDSMTAKENRKLAAVQRLW